MTEGEIRKALREYRAARELPSVKKSVPRAFRDSADAVAEALAQLLKEGR